MAIDRKMLPLVDRRAMQRWAKAELEKEGVFQGTIARWVGASQPAIGKLANHAEGGPALRDAILAYLKTTREAFLAEWGRPEDLDDGWRGQAIARGHDPDDPLVAEEYAYAFQGAMESYPDQADRGIARRRAQEKNKGSINRAADLEDSVPLGADAVRPKGSKAKNG